MEQQVLEQVDRRGLFHIGPWGLVNMKAAFRCYIEAVAAIQKAGVEVKGDLIVSDFVGEIEKAQVSRFQDLSGRRNRSALTQSERTDGKILR